MNFKNLFKNTLVLLFTLAVYSTNTMSAVTENPIKWHPGHYVMLVNPGKNNPSYMQNVYSELQSHSALRGIAVRYNWAELEKSKGVYDFSSIDKLLAGVKTHNKQMMILLEVKAFSTGSIVPSYLKTAEYEGGVFLTVKNGVVKGSNIKLWNTNVRERLNALAQAMGNHLNSHPNFEGMGMQETAMGTPQTPLTSVQINTYYKNLLIVNQTIRNSFPNTTSFQLTNYPRTILPTFIDGLKTMGTTLGATDIFIQEKGLLFQGTKYSPDGLYLYFPKLTNIIPLLAQVEQSNYLNTKHDKTGYKPTINELFVFGRDKLKVNYILWTRSPGYYDDVLFLLKQNAQANSVSGGLNATCPASIAICIQ